MCIRVVVIKGRSVKEGGERPLKGIFFIQILQTGSTQDIAEPRTN